VRDLKDRVAVVTGAGGGIGRALSLEVARAGAHVALADIDEERMRATATDVEALGRRAVTVVTDVRELSAVESLLERTLSELGACHVAFNNAGLFRAGPLLEASASDWERVVSTNLWGVVHGCRVFGAHFVAQHDGHIVNTASAAGLFPVPGMSSYSTTKFAIVALSEQLRWELAADGVGVTVVCPGVVKTGIAKAPGVGLERVDVDQLMKNAPPPEGLARKVIRAVERNRGMVRYGPDAYILSFLRLLPLWLIDPFGRFMARTSKAVILGLPPRSK